MAGVERFGAGSKRVQKVGNDAVYGTGIDGDVTITGTVTLTSDKYYNNLTVPLGNVLLTNGFRIFVKNTATINGVVGMGRVTGNSNGVTNGTIDSHTSSVQTGTTAGNQSTILYRAGGQGGGSSEPWGATPIPGYLINRISSLTGVFFDATVLETGEMIRGGSGGTQGSSGTPAISYTNSPTAPPGFVNTWPGKAGAAGSPGSAGGLGAYPPNAHTVGAAGGRGHSGSAGSAGNPGSAPNPPIAASGGAGGAGGAGGGVVTIVAKNIIGSGTIMSIGMSGSAGSVGTTSPAGPNGAKGSDGAAGSAAPGFTQHHHHAATIHDPCCTGHHHSPGDKFFAPIHLGHHHAATIHDPCCTTSPGHHYAGGAGGSGGTGGAGGTGSPAVTGGTGKRGGAGGGGVIILITEAAPSGLNYDVRPGTTADSDNFLASNGSAYIIINK